MLLFESVSNWKQLELSIGTNQRLTDRPRFVKLNIIHSNVMNARLSHNKQFQEKCLKKTNQCLEYIKQVCKNESKTLNMLISQEIRYYFELKSNT